MSIFDLQRGVNFKEQIKGMSYENIIKFAEENPLIPTDCLKDEVSTHSGHSATIQSYCNVVLVQPSVKLADIPNLIPSQELARDNATYWFSSLNPAILKIYTRVKSFCNAYGGMTEQDIEELTRDLNSPGGKDDFRQTMFYFKEETVVCLNEARALASDLTEFSLNLSQDLRNFQHIKSEADRLYSSANGRIPQLQESMKLELTVYNGFLTAIGELLAKLTEGLLSIAIGGLVTIFSLGTGVMMLIGSLIELIGNIVALTQLINESKNSLERYRTASEELNQLQVQCAGLQVIADDFDTLIESNAKANVAVTAIANTWSTLGNNFEALADSVQGVVDANAAIAIKIRLRAAIANAKDLKIFAEFCESQGLLPVIPEEETGRILRLPSSWIRRPIDGNVFRAFVESKRRLGGYGRGRRAWITRDKFICVPCAY